MSRTPTVWITLSLVATLVAAYLIRGCLTPGNQSTNGGDTARGRSEIIAPAPGPLPSLPPPPAFPPPPTPIADGQPYDADLNQVAELMSRFGLDPTALPQAYRTAWQAAEFRRLTPTNAMADFAYLELINDREKLHLELEFGLTNRHFLDELLALDVRSLPQSIRPEMLLPTSESVLLHGYNRRLQESREPMKRIAALLGEYGLQDFPYVLRAAEDIALLEVSLERHSAIERNYQEVSKNHPESANLLGPQLAQSLAGVKAVESVLSRAFVRMTGIQDPQFPAKLRAAGAGAAAALSPIRPPADVQQWIEQFDAPR
jgi:hypothetical protein